MLRTVLFGWMAMIGVRIKLLIEKAPGHYMVEIDARNAPEAPRWRIYQVGETPGRWEAPAVKRLTPNGSESSVSAGYARMGK